MFQIYKPSPITIVPDQGAKTRLSQNLFTQLCTISSNLTQTFAKPIHPVMRNLKFHTKNYYLLFIFSCVWPFTSFALHACHAKNISWITKAVPLLTDLSIAKRYNNDNCLQGVMMITGCFCRVPVVSKTLIKLIAIMSLLVSPLLHIDISGPLLKCSLT